MVEIDTLFQNKTGKKKNIPFGAAHTYIAYTRENPRPPPPPPAGAKKASETNNGKEMYNKVCCMCKVAY